MFTILQILASSAVIVVIIEVVFQSKTNRVRFLTSSRAEWRSNLKQYAEELDKSKKRNISQVLTKIKVNLNGYGCYNQDEYPSDVKLDFFRDEHIWREINYIEVACEKKHPSKKNIEQHKQRLIRFLSLLLKFDWERSKEEIKTNLIAVASVVVFVMMMVTCLIQISFHTKDTLSTLDILKEIPILAMPFLIVWIPYLVDNLTFMKDKKWYRYFAGYPLVWAFGTFVQFIVLHVYQIRYKIEITFPTILCVIAVTLAWLYPLIRRKIFIDYDNAIMRIMKIDSLIIYSMNSQTNDMRALLFFLKHELNCRLEYNKEEVLNDPDFKTYFKKLPNKKLLLRFFSGIWYRIRKEDILEFVKAKPKRCKMIVKFKTPEPQSEVKFSIGFKKKEWGEWIQ